MGYSGTTRLVLYIFSAVAWAASSDFVALSAKCTLVSPSGDECGFRGFVKHPHDSSSPYYTAKPQVVGSAEECARLCSRRAQDVALGQINYLVLGQLWCASFEYDTSSGLCKLGGQPPYGSIVKRNRTSTHKFYNLDCFDCGNICDQPLGAQLLDNGKFQQKLLGPWYSIDGDVSSPGFKSSRSWHCMDGDKCGLAQNWNKCPGALYAIRVPYKESPNSTKQDAINVAANAYGGGGYSVAWQATGTGSKSWKEGYLFLRTPHETQDYHSQPLDIGFSPETRGYLVDNVSVVRIDPHPALKPNATSLIINGGFETGNLRPWSVRLSHKAKFKVISPGIKSNYALKFTERSVSDVGVLEQVVATTVGRAYLFGMDVIYQGSGGYLFVEAELGSDDNSITHSISIMANSSLSIPYVARGAQTRVQIRFQETPALLDNVKLIELDNPVF